MSRGMRRGGIGGLGLVAVVVIAMFFGIDPGMLLQGGMQAPVQQSAPPARQSAGQDELSEFVSVVLADTEETWSSVFDSMGQKYTDPTLVLFTDAVQSACGLAEAATGPFYCPGDQKVYIDLGFYDELRNRFDAPGDFAQAYVIAHEIGHHVQNQLGIMDKVQNVRSQLDQTESNAVSVMLELQADCFAGIWAGQANASRDLLEPGDLEEGLRAAAAIGDDRLQRQATGRVVPDSFTHGSSDQRVHWFKQGYSAQSLEDCDTFDTAGS